MLCRCVGMVLRYVSLGEDPADRRSAGAVAKFEEFSLDPLVPQFAFSLAILSISVATVSLMGGRPDRCG
jgi:hypothetical protein